MPDLHGVPDAHIASFAPLDAVLFGEETLDSVQQLIVDVAQSALPDLYGASITIRRDGTMATSSYSGDAVLVLDQVQYDSGQGPCLDALRRGEQMEMGVGEEPAQWSALAEAARAQGVQSVLSTPLYLAADLATGLNLYSRSPQVDEGHQADVAFARRAAAVMANAVAFTQRDQLNKNLQEAIATREIIGEAKGILMEREGCSADQAFDILRRASQRTNRKLREIAQDLVQTVEARLPHP